jgi:FtsP/CotA-like multicopper oxidase with cupredoxin domain
MSRRLIPRRRFLVNASLGIAGAALAPPVLAQRMGGGGMGGGGSGGVIDPPPGPPFADPPVAANLSSAPGSVLVAIDARLQAMSVGGTTAGVLTYAHGLPDGTFAPAPGASFVCPTIRARTGDLVRLRFSSSLPANGEPNFLGHPKYLTNVHVHGWHVSPGKDATTGLPADDVHVQVWPGQAQEYAYDLRLARPGALGLYHPHVHGTVAEQMWGGLVGALLVEDDVATLGAYETRVLVLKDVALSGSAPAPYSMMSEYMHGKEGGVVTVNGQLNPVLGIRPGQVQRWRILNASNARFYRLSLQGHSLHVVGTDGGLLDKPYPVPEILLSPGERVDVLVRASRTAARYKLLSLPYARRGSMQSEQVTLLTLDDQGKRSSDALPSTVDPSARRLDPASLAIAKRPRFALGMGQGRGYINGISFEVLQDGTVQAFTHMSTVGTHEIWEIVNDSGMDHPWHQHVNDCQVLSIAGGNSSLAAYAQLYTGAPAWKDTVIVPKWGSATLLVPVMDYPGHTMFHCHIVEHEDIGMMGMWHIMEMM